VEEAGFEEGLALRERPGTGEASPGEARAIAAAATAVVPMDELPGVLVRAEVGVVTRAELVGVANLQQYTCV
jgi:hypothetical protein